MTGPLGIRTVSRPRLWREQHPSSTEGTLTARDAHIAGVAKELDESLGVADSDFDVEGITDLLNVVFL